jgi:dihydropteroate synthase
MGIVNATPDSFSDGGAYDALAHALRLAEEGADILDIGGESTRPGAAEVSVDEEIRRTVPVIAALARAFAERPDAPLLSIDTRRATTAKAAIEAGARLVNDVSAGADPAMFPTCAAAGCGMVLMHMRGTPATMQSLTDYGDVGAEVWATLHDREIAARQAGVPAVLLDPGLGFAKTAEQNWALLRDLARRKEHRILVGASRKSFLGALTGQTRPADRLEASLAVALHCARVGVEVVRVHDVAATRRAFLVHARLAAN